MAVRLFRNYTNSVEGGKMCFLEFLKLYKENYFCLLKLKYELLVLTEKELKQHSSLVMHPKIFYNRFSDL